MLHLITAMDTDGAIGRGGQLLYHIPADMRLFKSLTTGNTIIMGRKTFESLPKGALPGRRNIVVTRNRSWTAPNTETAPSLEAAIDMASAGPGEPFIIGGGEIYRQALPLADVLHLTIIDASTPGADTFFPDFNPDDYELTDEQTLSDAPLALAHTLRRIKR
ncbi:MAG: dihydrofolate reductase [Muribaculaceae bacterium]|nr:dihydrofolate reductase [Muribaculaceae bacterium]MDE6135291.1 dihydrofolate reductase [Muribaculaceae bacterium]